MLVVVYENFLMQICVQVLNYQLLQHETGNRRLCYRPVVFDIFLVPFLMKRCHNGCAENFGNFSFIECSSEDRREIVDASRLKRMGGRSSAVSKTLFFNARSLSKTAGGLRSN